MFPGQDTDTHEYRWNLSRGSRWIVINCKTAIVWVRNGKLYAVNLKNPLVVSSRNDLIWSFDVSFVNKFPPFIIFSAINSIFREKLCEIER